MVNNVASLCECRVVKGQLEASRIISRISVASDKLTRNLRAKISTPTLTCSRYHRRYSRRGCACRTLGKYDDFAPCVTAPALAFIPISHWAREKSAHNFPGVIDSTKPKDISRNKDRHCRDVNATLTRRKILSGPAANFTNT